MTEHSHTLSNGLVEVGLNPVGGQLEPVCFFLDGQPVRPLHHAPWLNEPHRDLPPMLQNLQGDFFCAPFGDNDLLPEETRPHGRTANGTWLLQEKKPLSLRYELSGTVANAHVTKELSLREGQPLVYQRHIFSGGNSSLPIGHHAMLRADEPLELSFSPWVWGGTPPAPVETDATGGRSRLAYPQTFDDLAAVKTQAGERVDLSTFPVLERSEEILMLVSQDAPLAWSAACAPQAGWLWFALKIPATLQSTMLWLSNGGRDYAPFSGRHARVIGIEEVTSYFHLGHAASSAPNLLSDQGYRTALTLTPEAQLEVRYAFGLVAIPTGFERLLDLSYDGEHLYLQGVKGQVAVPYDSDFFSPTPSSSGPL